MIFLRRHRFHDTEKLTSKCHQENTLSPLQDKALSSKRIGGMPSPANMEIHQSCEATSEIMKRGNNRLRFRKPFRPSDVCGGENL
mmetsp:Transcript_30625/g.55439  ORF Transcript_30625/g.55439 Transcript_30625/m.55439 type:complete len:85 (-) Transcript_30625:688-942(-)